MKIDELFSEIASLSSKTKNERSGSLLHCDNFKKVFPKIIQYCCENDFNIKQYCDHDNYLTIVFKKFNIEDYDMVDICISERRKSVAIRLKYNQSSKTNTYNFVLFEFQDISIGFAHRRAMIKNIIQPYSNKYFLSDVLKSLEDGLMCWLLLNGIMIYERRPTIKGDL